MVPGKHDKDSRKGRGQETQDDYQKKRDLLDSALRTAQESNAFIAQAMAAKILANEVGILQTLTSDLKGDLAKDRAHRDRLIDQSDQTNARLSFLEREHFSISAEGC